MHRREWQGGVRGRVAQGRRRTQTRQRDRAGRGDARSHPGSGACSSCAGRRARRNARRNARCCRNARRRCARHACMHALLPAVRERSGVQRDCVCCSPLCSAFWDGASSVIRGPTIRLAWLTLFITRL